MRKYELSTEAYTEKDVRFQKKYAITEEDRNTFYRVQKYYYVMDALSWCSDNDLPCSDELAEAMAGYVEDNHDSTLSHWDNFEAAYYACADAESEEDDDMQFAGDIYGCDDVYNDVYGGESLD